MVDIDGVIYRWEDTIRYLILAHHGIEIERSTHWNYVRDKLKSMDRYDVWQWLWNEGLRDHGMFRYGSIYKGAREGLVKLNEVADIIVCTSRPLAAMQDTLDWLAYQHFPTKEFSMIQPGQTKANVRADIYVDDGPDNIGEILTQTDGVMVIWDRPWNDIPLVWEYEKKYSERVHRTNDWNRLVEIVSGVKGNES